MKTDRRLLLAAVGFTALAACNGTKPTVITPAYTVEYTINVTGSVTIDSVMYDNGLGVFVKVVHPFPGEIKTLAPNPPFTVRSKAWVRLAASSSATLKQTWTHLGSGFNADSLVFVTTSAPDSGIMILPTHTIN